MCAGVGDIMNGVVVSRRCMAILLFGILTVANLDVCSG